MFNFILHVFSLTKSFIIVLGNVKKPCFKKPGAIHRARWMYKGSTSLKVYMFRDEFNLSVEEEEGLKRICIFVVTTYIYGWYRAPLPLSAPRKDLKFHKELSRYENIDSKIAEKTVEKFSRHLWYLSEETVLLTLFDDRVSVSQKQKMISALNLSEEPRRKVARSSTKRQLKGNIENQDIENLSLDYFVTEKSIRFFETLQLEDSSFIHKQISQWPRDDSYIKCLTKCKI